MPHAAGEEQVDPAIGHVIDAHVFASGMLAHSIVRKVYTVGLDTAMLIANLHGERRAETQKRKYIAQAVDLGPSVRFQVEREGSKTGGHEPEPLLPFLGDHQRRSSALNEIMLLEVLEVDQSGRPLRHDTAICIGIQSVLSHVKRPNRSPRVHG